MGVLNVLYQSDDNYAIFMGVSICSLLENNRAAEEINIYVIDDSISGDMKRQIEQMVGSYQRRVRFVPTESVLNNDAIRTAFAYTGMRKNTHSYLKLFVDMLLPDISGRIVYIDCDTAIEGDISPLAEMDMQGHGIGMVLDSLVTDGRCSVGMRADDNYYNSGVILIDLDVWRREHYAERIINHVQNVRTYGTVDQDILNMEFLHDIYTLPVAYNLQPMHLVYPYKMYAKVYRHKEPYYGEREIAEAVNAPKIIHYLRYVGTSPWHSNSVHPCEGIFDKYLALSPWKDYQKKPIKSGMLFKIERFLYTVLPKPIFLRIFYVVHERMITKSNQRKVLDR